MVSSELLINFDKSEQNTTYLADAIINMINSSTPVLEM